MSQGFIGLLNIAVEHCFKLVDHRQALIRRHVMHANLHIQGARMMRKGLALLDRFLALHVLIETGQKGAGLLRKRLNEKVAGHHGLPLWILNHPIGILSFVKQKSKGFAY